MTNSILIIVAIVFALTTNAPEVKEPTGGKNTIERPGKRDDFVRSVIVKVRKPNLDPLQGATVLLYASGSTAELASVSTNANGVVDFGLMPCGGYNIKVVATGYSDAIRNFILGGKDASIIVVMQ
jgi:hypothetical protein